jgi:hypothetical protein
MRQGNQRFRTTALVATTAALAALASAPAAAQESYSTWDTFGAAEINFDRWLFGERVRRITNGALVHAMRDYGDQWSNTGGRRNNWNTSFDEPNRITQMRAQVTPVSYDLTGCAANTTPSTTWVRLIGGYFNTGTPTPGNQTNDVLGEIRMVRSSDSADPPDTMRIEGQVTQCTASDCSAGIVLGNVALGTTTLGTTVRLQVEWDQPTKTFSFRTDSNAVQTVTYTVPDISPPGTLFRQLNTRTFTANCLAGPRTTARIEARFDQVQVNQSGTP